MSETHSMEDDLETGTGPNCGCNDDRSASSDESEDGCDLMVGYGPEHWQPERQRPTFLAIEYQQEELEERESPEAHAAELDEKKPKHKSKKKKSKKRSRSDSDSSSS